MKDAHDKHTADLPLPAPEPGKRGRGRPRKHEDAAAKQKAYRERKRAAGLTEVRHWVRDVSDGSKPLASDIIDLSEVRPAKKPPSN